MLVTDIDNPFDTRKTFLRHNNQNVNLDLNLSKAVKMGDSNIGEYRVLPHMPDADFAMTRLRKMVDTVRPILRKYNLYVHVLAEFYPDPGLLGLNTGHGQLIEVRMRCVQRRDEFVSFEAMLDTFLHE